MAVEAGGKAHRTQAANKLRVLELQTAKEILAEVFHTRSKDVDEMIQRRLEEWDSRDWPATFCLGE
jgi:ribose 1,5-bisphosphokinase PhnN